MSHHDHHKNRLPAAIRRLAVVASITLTSAGAEGAELKPTDPLSPREALASFQPPDGFEIELVACEPEVRSPVAIDWGPDGRLWVVEMADYPAGIDNRGKPGGRLKVLESTRGDGRYDKATLVADALDMPNGVAVWRDGAIVTAAPDILYLEQGAAPRPLFTGFKPGNPQLRVNGLRWGMDGWLYCANGWSGGRARSVKTGQTLPQLDRKDLRINPDTGSLELESGMSEFGRDPNDFGDWFGCDNSHPLFHFVLAERYARRFPPAPLPDPKVQVIVPANPRVYPASPVQQRFYTDRFGYFTSACSATIYRDDLLFGAAGGGDHMFVCEPAYNLVHHEVVRDAGVSFTAARAAGEAAREFLASRDPWFRPVMARTGPDGALWVVDMYRFMIEHPDWLPPEGKKALAPYYREGADRGRIYRIFPKGRRPRPVPRFDRLSTPALANTLGSSNGTVRDMVQKQLTWRADAAAEAVEPLRRLAAESAIPAARVQALYTLAGLHAATDDVLLKALADAHPAVRRSAIRLAEDHHTPALVTAALKLADDPDPKVRLQLACSLGGWRGADADAAVARMAAGDAADDPYLAAALMTGAGLHTDAILTALERGGKCDGPLYDGAMACMVALDRRDDQARLLSAVLVPRGGSYTTAQFGAFVTYLDRTAARRTGPSTRATADALSAILDLQQDMIRAARAAASDEAQPAARRAAATGLLGADDVDLLAALLSPRTPVEVQHAAVAALARTGAAGVPDVLTRDWASHSPRLRTACLDVLLSREPWALALVRAAKAGTFDKNQIDAARRERLLNHRSQQVRSLARQVLGAPPNPQRRQVVESYRPALRLEGDAKRGAALFAQNCAVCHRANGAGADVGPDLNSVAAWQGEALLTAILDPSRDVQPQYLAYTATLNDGDALYGIIASESGDVVTIKGLDGKSVSVPRGRIKSLNGTSRSLMPDGLEAVLSPQGMADVIRFLQGDQGP